MEEKVIFVPKTVKIKGGEILIRLLREEDGPQLALEEQAQGWGTTTEKFETRMRDFAAGACIPLCAELDGKPVGYVNLYKEPGGSFAGTGWPYIVDFAVLERVRGRGVGSALMDAVEALAAETSDTVCLGLVCIAATVRRSACTCCAGTCRTAPACGMRAACGTNMRRA